MIEMNDMVPPHNRDAEQSVIGALLLSPDAFDNIAGLEPGMFYNRDHAIVYATIARMIAAREVVDVVTVAEAMERAGELEEIGGLGYLASLAQNTPSVANIKRHAQIVREKWQARKLMSVGMAIHDMVAVESISDALGKAGAMLSEIAEAHTGNEPQRIGNALTLFIEQMEAAQESGTGIVGLPTGLSDLDERLGGMRGGQLILIAGRPSMGKSSLGIQIASHVAQHGTPSLVLSMEMTAQEISAREVARAGKLSVSNLMRGRMAESDWAGLTHGISIVNDLPMLVDEQGGLSVAEVGAKIRTARRKHNIGLVVIDYLQMMRGSGEANRNQELESITRSLKAVAKEIGIPIIALSQLSRKCEERTNKRPIPSDLRESGALEQDADVIMFVYRDEVYNTDTPDIGIAEIIIAKQRNGPIGTVHTVWLREQTAFATLQGGYQQPARQETKQKRGFN